MRTQRRSDGTIAIERRRYEIPSRYRHIRRVCVRYARWNLTSIDLVDDRSGQVLARLYPEDKTQNADGARRTMEPLPDAADLPPWEEPSDGVAPLLRQLMDAAAATGLPPSYVPFAYRDEEADDAKFKLTDEPKGGNA